MKTRIIFLLICILSLNHFIEAKKKKKGSKKTISSGELKCLVCRALSEEIDGYIAGIDPNKKTVTGTFRIDSNGKQEKTIIPYARSQESLYEMIDKICERFSDYAQATNKSTGKLAVIPLTTPKGNMNPNFSDYNILPDDELNKKLTFHCQSIVEDLDDEIISLYAVENAEKLESQLCSNICPEGKKEEL